MQGIRFYAELPGYRGSKSATRRHRAFTRSHLDNAAETGGHYNCLAIFASNGRNLAGDWEGYAPANDRTRSQVEHAGVTPDYLRSRCVRICEATARKLHPELFSKLEALEKAAMAADAA